MRGVDSNLWVCAGFLGIIWVCSLSRVDRTEGQRGGRIVFFIFLDRSCWEGLEVRLEGRGISEKMGFFFFFFFPGFKIFI